jgi:hypothetical protein
MGNCFFSLLSPALMWATGKVISLRTKVGLGGPLAVGAMIGFITSLTMYSTLRPNFLAITNTELGGGSFVYSGLLSGVLAGELFRRQYSSSAGVHPIGEALKRRFLVSALMIWAVLLRVLESLYLSTLPPGNDPFAVHLFMFMSVLLWTPLVCLGLWKFRPSGLFPAAILSVGAGILFPLLVGWALSFPVVIGLYVGITPSIYAMLWGRLLLNVSGPKILVATMFILPGLSWGLLIGALRAHYLQVEKNAAGLETGRMLTQ